MKPSTGRLLLLYCCLLLPPLFSGAQNSERMLSLRFSRQNNFTWNTYQDLNYAFSKNRYGFDLRVHHDNIYNQSLDSDRFVQIYSNADLWQHYRIDSSLSVTSWFEMDQFLNSHTEKYSLYGGVTWRPAKLISFTPLLGYAFDQRDGRFDHGFTPAGRLNIAYDLGNGVTTETQAFGRYKFIRPRQQRNVHARHLWNVRFENNSSLRFGVNAGSHELDNYLANSVQRTITDTVNPHFRLLYEFLPGLMWESTNEMHAFRRNFRYGELAPDSVEFNDKSFSGLSVSTRQQLSLKTKKFRATAYYQYEYLSRFYQLVNSRTDPISEFERQLDREKEKDFLRDLHTVEAVATWQLMPRHVVEGKYVVRYMQYDTPSEVNFDDRDELSYLVSGAVRSQWRRNFQTSAGLSANYRHYAFLFKEKSEDNYIQRSLRMDFGFDWNLWKQLRLEGNSAVYVTYNVKNFEDRNKTDRSTRNLETNFGLHYRPTDRIYSKLTFNRKETHQSYLNWIAFSETTLDTNRITIIESSNRYYFKIKRGKVRLYADLGYKHFDQTKMLKTSMFDLNEVLKPIHLRRITTQTGPSTTIGYRDFRQSAIDLNVWFQVQIQKNRFAESTTLTSISAPYREENLRIVTTELRPFVTLRFNYFFE